MPNSAPGENSNPPSVSYCAKRGIAYGAALGMLIGLLYLAVWRGGEVTEIVLWRNFILAGAAVGLAAGWIAGMTVRSRWDRKERSRSG